MIAGIVLAGILTGCDGGTGGPATTTQSGSDLSEQLAETVWVISEVYQGAEGVLLDPRLGTRQIPSAVSWVSFASAGSFEGEGPCNRFRGSYNLEGGTLRVHSGSMQAGACPVGPDVADSEVATSTELLILSPFIAETRFAVSIADGELLLATDTLSLVYVAVQG